ncbi:hypothetical protein B0H14DRAFT_2907096 [Mycena olivaceomarginata]|nr:hypothetical protein B0H14DRAFT_2907096 [Mycena olivaceomarginata]
MGKTSLGRAVLHHPQITGKYECHRFFVACDSASTKVDLGGLIGALLGLKPGKDLTYDFSLKHKRPPVLCWTYGQQTFCSSPPGSPPLWLKAGAWVESESERDAWRVAGPPEIWSAGVSLLSTRLSTLAVESGSMG